MNGTAVAPGAPIGASGANTRLDIGQVLKDGWVLFTKDWVALVVGSFLASLIAVVTLGILGPVLFGGLYRMVIRRVREGRPAEIGDIFSCFDRFGPLFLFALMMFAIVFGLIFVAFIPLIAAAGLFSGDSEGLQAAGAGMVFLTVVLFLVVYVAILYLSIIWFYVLQLIVERGMGLGEALRHSKGLVMANSFWMHVLIMLIVGMVASAVVSLISTVTFGIGGVLGVAVWPWQLTCFMSMYFQVSGDRHLLPSAAPGMPGSAYQGGGRAGVQPGWGTPGGPPPGVPQAPWQGGPAAPPAPGAPPPTPPPPTPPAPPGQTTGV